MQNKVALITGANSGTGKWTATELARTGYITVMMCRDKSRGEDALLQVKSISKSNDVDLMFCDLSSLESIRNFTSRFKEKYDRLDVLVNNAGVILPGRHETLDGYELQFGVNHLGHFLLTNLLLDLIIKSGPSRIINVASGGHKAGKIYFEDINLRNNFSMTRAYSQSKLANVLFTYELARRLREKNVTVNTLHPGAVASNMGINRDTGFGKMITGILKPFFQTPLKGAETAIYLASSSEVEGITGKYFYKKKQVPSSKLSYDIDLARRLWDLSEEMVGLHRNS